MRSDGMLSYEYAQDSRTTGVTGHAGLLPYIDLACVLGFLKEVDARVGVCGEQGWMDRQHVLFLMLLNLAGGGCGGHTDYRSRTRDCAGYCVRRSYTGLAVGLVGRWRDGFAWVGGEHFRRRLGYTSILTSSTTRELVRQGVFAGTEDMESQLALPFATVICGGRTIV